MTDARCTVHTTKFLPDGSGGVDDVDGPCGSRLPCPLHPWKKAEDPPNPVPCLSCGADMRRRTNRATGQAFWGCSTYPRCFGTRDGREGDLMAVGDSPDPDELDIDSDIGDR